MVPYPFDVQVGEREGLAKLGALRSTPRVPAWVELGLGIRQEN